MYTARCARTAFFSISSSGFVRCKSCGIASGYKFKSSRALASETRDDLDLPQAAPVDLRSPVLYDRTRLQEVTIAGRRLLGVSVGASETCIISPEHMAFDIGRCPRAALRMQVVAFTHLHVDHVAGVPFHIATRSMQRMPPPIYIVPRPVAQEFAAMIEAFGKLDGSSFEYTLVPMSPGETYQLKKGWVVRPFQTMHTVPSQGYILYEVRNKLLPKLAGMSTSEIAALRFAGAPIVAQVLVPQLAVTGDTTLDALAECPDARQAKALVTEMTFLDNVSSEDQARLFGHVHIDEVVRRAEELFSEAEGVLFTHFSARYCAREILSTIDAKIPPTLKAKTTALVGEVIEVHQN